MVIKVELLDPKFCDGCPCLELYKTENLRCKCRHHKHYEIKRFGLTRWEQNEKYGKPIIGNPDLIDYFETPRPKKCIRENGK